MTEKEKFESVYEDKINSFTNKTISQIRALLFNSKDSNIEIKLVEKGTSIEVVKNYITLRIGFNEVQTMKKLGFSDFDAFCKVVTHEYLHLALGHFSFFVTDKISYFAKGNDKYLYGKNVESPFFVYNHNSVIRHEFTINRKILNIAGDFEINDKLGIGKPFLNPVDFELPSGLTTKEYYSIIYHVLFWKEGCGQSSYLHDYYFRLKDRFEKLISEVQDGKDSETGISDISIQHCDDYKGKVFNVTDKLPDKEFKKLVEMKMKSQSFMTDATEKLNNRPNGVWKEFRDIAKEIDKVEGKAKLSLVDKAPCWTKFNNRREDPVLLTPGKILTKGTIDLKFDYYSVLFIDVSGSMFEFYEQLYALSYYLLGKNNVQICTYNSNLEQVFNNRRELEFMDFNVSGGTYFERAYEDFCNTNFTPRNIYIITDGYDQTLSRFPQEIIFKAQNGSIKKEGLDGR